MFLRRLTPGLALLAILRLPMQAGQPALELEITSLVRTDDSLLRLTFRSAPNQPVAIDGSTDLATWTEITNTTSNASGSITISETNAIHRYYRAVAQDAYFVGALRSETGAVLPGGAITIEATGQTYFADAAGDVKIATRFLPFSSGYRARAAAPEHFDQTVNISPFTYFYSFTLSTTAHTGPAPASLSLVEFLTGPGSGVGENARYTVAFAGTTSGTFDLREWSGAQGSFTYSPNGDIARLRMDYSTFPGDFDDITLSFTSDPALGNSFSGMQRVGGIDYMFNGWFWIR